MILPGDRRFSFKRRIFAFSVVFLLVIALFLSGWLGLRGPETLKEAVAIKALPIDAGMTSVRGIAPVWKPSVSESGGGMAAPPAPSFDSSDRRITDPPREIPAASPEPVPADGSERRRAHLPAVASVSTGPQIVTLQTLSPAPPSGSGRSWRPAREISLTEAIELRRRIANGERIFRRADTRPPGPLDEIRGRIPPRASGNPG